MNVKIPDIYKWTLHTLCYNKTYHTVIYVNLLLQFGPLNAEEVHTQCEQAKPAGCPWIQNLPVSHATVGRKLVQSGVRVRITLL